MLISDVRTASPAVSRRATGYHRPVACPRGARRSRDSACLSRGALGQGGPTVPSRDLVGAIGERYRERAAAPQPLAEERSVTDKNLDLDTGRGSKVGASDALARVCVVLACGYVKDGGATTLTPDCRSYEEFEREVERLKGELDSILKRSRAHAR